MRRQLVGSGIGCQDKESPEDAGMGGFLEGDGHPIGAGTDGAGRLGLARADEVGIGHLDGDLIGKRVKRAVECDHAQPICARG